MSERVSSPTISRRALLKGSGALVVGFSLAGPVARAAVGRAAQAASGQAAAALQATSAAPPADHVDSWLTIGADNAITIRSGKVELGTGIRTALAQIAADELYVPVSQVRVVAVDAGASPDEGTTSGSKTLQQGGPNVRNACAEARQALLELAAARFGLPLEALVTADGAVHLASGPGATVSYGDLIGARRFERAVSGTAPTRNPSTYDVVGQPVPRVDLPPKILGAAAYLQDLRLPGMLHGRVVRPPTIGATLADVGEGSVRDLPGFVAVVRNGNFLGVVAEREEQAIRLARALQATWQPADPLPAEDALFDYLRTVPAEDRVLVERGDADTALAEAATTLQATYTVPYQLHGSIGPSCAVADVQPDRITVYSSTQGVYPLQGALAQLVGVAPAQVHIVYIESAGCYGHNGFDDAAADALLLSRAVGRPVRVQWMRGDEHAWEPKGPPVLAEVRGALDDQGNVAAWDYDVWTPNHSARPGGQAANLLAGQLVDPAPPPAQNRYVGGDRNAPTNYTFPHNRVTIHWLQTALLRPSALRGLGSAGNVFANESFLDELAAVAGADPVEFRLRHLDDPRARAVVQAAAERAGWEPRPSPAPRSMSGGVRGRGIAFLRYENEYTYAAMVAEVEVDRASGQIRVARVTVAHDCGLIVNPDGLRNQIEGNVVQSTSRALLERVRFDDGRVTSADWESYPILRFSEVPAVEIVLIDHPEEPAWGAGEVVTAPTSAAIANAVFDATGIRLRQVPFTPAVVRAALAAQATTG
ncbi:MAG TPA: molybdopterin cofactor-binding domain-containing protein [Chloroflexota bacterium]|jgi:CO/xanthine dehydrogenase Mo-binding subunit